MQNRFTAPKITWQLFIELTIYNDIGSTKTYDNNYNFSFMSEITLGCLDFSCSELSEVTLCRFMFLFQTHKKNIFASCSIDYHVLV